MGLTGSSTGGALNKHRAEEYRGTVCSLAGPPNVGKSSLFNALTGLDQHTGNWTGKTVASAVGYCEGEDITFVDLPGTYSLHSGSPEEELARDFIISGSSDAVCVVCDALALERGLSLALKTLELTQRVTICVNFMDEAKKRGVLIDCERLSELMGVRVVPVSAKKKHGLCELCKAIKGTAAEPICDAGYALTYPEEIEKALKARMKEKKSRHAAVSEMLSDADLPESTKNTILSRPIIMAEAIALEVTSGADKSGYSKTDRLIDRIVTNRFLSVPLMLLLFMGIFWLSAVGANYPSAALGAVFERLEAWIYETTGFLPDFLHEMLVAGALRTLFRVVAVMLPPMAIFFPLFTLLEDFGLLGRIAFNLDGAFCRASACGKQALTMCMGLGCNAAGVVGCRIIESPRERLIAVLTNSFMPCNGRFPILITLSTLLFSGVYSGIGTAITMTAVIAVGTLATLAVSKLLSVTLLKGKPSSFVLELPSYRMPNIGQVIVRSIFDRTLFVLARAAVVAIPAGIVIWLLANTDAGGASLLRHFCTFLDPIGHFIGLDGAVLCAFILAFPANEIVLPIILMCYTASGALGGDVGIAELLLANGWTSLSYINMMILTVFHFPCSTTVLTVKKETHSLGYAVLSMIIPTAIGFLLCALTTAASRII